jgi:tRNA pseudouridine55 synthase
MRLGVETSSYDAEGDVVRTTPVPSIEASAIEAAFAKFRGDFYQTPPMVSAIKKDGVPLYKLARQGKDIAREPRFVHVYASEVTACALPDVSFHIVCSKGFYVRSFAHDVGHELGCGAHLAALRRTKSGRFAVEGAVRAEDLKTLPAGELRSRVMSLPAVSRLRGA